MECSYWLNLVKLGGCKKHHNNKIQLLIQFPVMKLLASIWSWSVFFFFFSQFDSGSIHFEREGGGFFPPSTWRGKKSAEFEQEVEEEGGWAPFMPNITILIALMLFLVGGGRGGREERQKAQSALHSDAFNHHTTDFSSFFSIKMWPLLSLCTHEPLLNYHISL